MTSLGVYAPYGPWEALPHHPTNLGVSARLTIESERYDSIDDLMEAIAREQCSYHRDPQVAKLSQYLEKIPKSVTYCGFIA